MSKDMFRERERAEEEAYFHQRDAVLIERLRQRAKLSDVAHALAEKLQTDEPAMLEHIKRLGVSLDTGAAFILAPLDGKPTLYRVRLGPISSVPEFDRLAAKLKALGYPDARLATD